MVLQLTPLLFCLTTGETHEQGHRSDDAVRGEPEEDL